MLLVLQVSSHLLSSEARAPASQQGSTVTISSTNQTVIGDPNSGTLVSNQTTPSQVVNSTTQVCYHAGRSALIGSGCISEEALTPAHTCAGPELAAAHVQT